jgi:hypothetical protein
MKSLRAALPWQYRTRVGNDRVANMSPDLRRRLKATVLQVP